MTSNPQPNVGRDLQRLHKSITRGLSVVFQYSQAPGPLPEHRQGFRTYVNALINLLDAHHLGEDEISFPFWQSKNPQAPIEQLSQHHRSMEPLFAQTRTWLDSGEGAWSAAGLAQLNATYLALNQLWQEHISLEEEVMSEAQAASLLSPEENQQLGGQLAAHGQQHAQPSEIVLPFVVYNLNPADRQEFSVTLPPVVVQQLIPGPWKAAWGPMTPYLLD